MKAIGFIETKGLLPAIECADAMLKAAEVTLIDRAFVGGGLVTITVSGDVAAVKASVDAGAAAVERIPGATLITQHVIPRPHEELDGLILPTLVPDDEPNEAPEKEDDPDVVYVEPKAILPQEPKAVMVKETKPAKVEIPDKLSKKSIDDMMKVGGVDQGLKALKTARVVELRTLAREYSDFGILGREISEANKGKLLDEFKKYYKN